MNLCKRTSLIEFKRTAREGKAYLDSDCSWADTGNIKETLNNVLVWLSEVKETLNEMEQDKFSADLEALE